MPRSSSRQTHHRNRRYVGSPDSPAFLRTPLALSLPAISSQIPAELDGGEDEAQWAKLALLWLDELPVGNPNEGPARVVQKAVAHWIERVTGGFRGSIDFDVRVGMSVESVLGWMTQDTGEPDRWYFAYEHAGTSLWSMHRLADLEAGVPGLGETAWDIIGAAAARTVEGMAPEFISRRAEWLWWHGNCTQEDLVEELASQGYSEAEIREYPSVEWVQNAYPTYIRNPTRKLDDAALAKLSESGATEFVRESAALLVTMSQLIAKNAVLPYLDGDLVDGECAHLGVLLKATRDDTVITQFVDDWYQMVNESGDGFHEAYGLSEAPFDRMKFRRWKVNMEKGLRLFAALDRFLDLAGIREEIS